MDVQVVLEANAALAAGNSDEALTIINEVSSPHGRGDVSRTSDRCIIVILTHITRNALVSVVLGESQGLSIGLCWKLRWGGCFRC